MVSSTYRNHTKGSKNASPISRLFDRLLPYIVYSMQYRLRSAPGCCRVCVFFCVFGNLFCFVPFALSLPLNRFDVSFLLRKKKNNRNLCNLGYARPRNCRYCLHRFSHVCWKSKSVSRIKDNEYDFLRGEFSFETVCSLGFLYNCALFSKSSHKCYIIISRYTDSDLQHYD